MRTDNHYCSTCMCTRSFVDHSDHLDCPTCEKRLWRVADDKPVAARIAWITRPRRVRAAPSRLRRPAVAALEA
ncbi:MAG: hypothetical protein ACYTGN_18360 [Planctomycetota bacterium]|jgi:hypothetical protein